MVRRSRMGGDGEDKWGGWDDEDMWGWLRG